MELPQHDSRQEIMSALERPGGPTQGGRGQRDASQTQKIPTTVEEFMELERLTEWPEHVTSEHPIQHDASAVLGDEMTIRELLRQAAPLEDQLAVLDALEDRANKLESSLMKYAEFILSDENRKSRIKNGTFYSNAEKLFLTEVSHEESKGREEIGKSTAAAVSLVEKRKRDVNFVNFPGFRDKELTELPGQLETPQLLHRITKAQNFNAGFAKFWKKIFLSEASVAVVQDLFWWCFLRIFKPNTSDEQDHLFDRLADSFAALFLSIHSDIRDKIFKVYPGVLSQAIFMIFYDAFPESHRMFGPIFKEELVCYCWELITGTKPPPGTWKNWDIDRLQAKKSERDKSAIAGPDQKIGQSTYDFNALHEVITNLDSITKEDGEILQKEKLKPVSKRRRKQIESCLAGPGPDIEKTMFNLSGLSPLIAHFLNMKHLKDLDHSGRKVTRTEVVGQASGEQTYDELIAQRKALAKVNKAQYNKLCKETNDEINRIEHRKNMVIREIEKLKRDSNSLKYRGHDVKFLADRMISKMLDDEPHRPMQLITEDGEVNTERESESDLTDSEIEEKILADVEMVNSAVQENASSLGGNRADVETVICNKKKIAERRERKKQTDKDHFLINKAVSEENS